MGEYKEGTPIGGGSAEEEKGNCLQAITFRSASLNPFVIPLSLSDLINKFNSIYNQFTA